MGVNNQAILNEENEWFCILAIQEQFVVTFMLSGWYLVQQLIASKKNPIWYQNVSKYLDYTEDLERWFIWQSSIKFCFI